MHVALKLPKNLIKILEINIWVNLIRNLEINTWTNWAISWRDCSWEAVDQILNQSTKIVGSDAFWKLFTKCENPYQRTEDGLTDGTNSVTWAKKGSCGSSVTILKEGRESRDEQIAKNKAGPYGHGNSGHGNSGPSNSGDGFFFGYSLNKIF